MDLVQIALDFALPNGHDAQACNNVTMAILKRYDIRHSNIILSINNTIMCPS
jgi:hypothetical protein